MDLSENIMNKIEENYTLLLIEDNLGDIRLMHEALQQNESNLTLEVVRDGVEALRYLKKESPYEKKPVPDIILLDLNLPRWDGCEVLRRIKSDELLRKIPVIVLTTSNAAQDVISAYDLHANCFIDKPIDYDGFLHILRQIETFWLKTSILPTRAGRSLFRLG
jgi:two-component system, chemotaxis family, response regulator Rcp1